MNLFKRLSSRKARQDGRKSGKKKQEGLGARVPVSDSSLYERHDSVDMEALQRSPSNGVVIPDQLATLAGSPMVLVMVGLPARGKSYITKKLVRYLQWRGFRCQEFNAGNKRRELMDGGGQTADFFHGTSSKRDEIAKLTFDDLANWLKSGGHVAVFDATNTTVQRRKLVLDWCREAKLPDPIFVESICDDEELLNMNYRLKLKNDDYKDMDAEVALADFKKRVEEYEMVYEPVSSGNEGDNVSYIKLFNVGSKVIINRCWGFLVSQIIAILQNFHVTNRRIFLTRHGESEDNLEGRIGGDSSLTKKGRDYARRLCDFIQDIRQQEEDKGEDGAHKKELTIATSVLKRSVETARPFKKLKAKDISFLHTNQLNEINAGLCDGMTYEEVEKEYPEVAQSRKDNKLMYRYPMGESYVDVINRLNPIVLDLERLRHDILIIGHNACIRALMGYFLASQIDEVPYLDAPLHCVFEIKPGAFKCDLIVHDLYKEK